jgi:anti-sigma factor RsiW
MTVHLEDGTLVRQLDGALEEDEISVVPAHLASCGPCANRLATLGRRSQRLNQLLAATDVPVPSMTLRTSRWFVPSRAVAVAAVVLLLLASAIIAVRPARAWIVERSLELWTLMTGGTDEVPAPDDQVGTTSASATAVSFTPSGDHFLIRVSGYQQAGVVTVETAAVSQVTAEVRGGAATEDLVVLPDGLRIVNTIQSAADYHVLLPATLGEITVEVAGHVAANFRPRGALSSWTVLLKANGSG